MDFKFESKVKKFENQLWGHHIEVPDSIAQNFIKEKEKRIVCKLNDDKPFQCALLPNGKNSWFININKEIRERLKLRIGSEVNVVIRKDNSKYGLPIIPEVEELFLQDVEGSELFHSLTKGKQRTLLYLINKPKNIDLKLRNGINILDFLKMTKGELDFKMLNNYLKQNK